LRWNGVFPFRGSLTRRGRERDDGGRTGILRGKLKRTTSSPTTSMGKKEREEGGREAAITDHAFYLYKQSEGKKLRVGELIAGSANQRQAPQGYSQEGRLKSAPLRRRISDEGRGRREIEKREGHVKKPTILEERVFRRSRQKNGSSNWHIKLRSWGKKGSGGNRHEIPVRDDRP